MDNQEALTTRQRMILEYIMSEVRKKGYPPSVREIGKAFGLSSTSTVHSHLKNLEKKGYIRRANTPRSIEILDDGFYRCSQDLVDVPLLRSAVLDADLFTGDNIISHLSISADFLPKNKAVLMFCVQDNSLRKKNILKGDNVLVSKQDHAESGDVVLACHNHSSLIRTLLMDGQQLLLVDGDGQNPIPLDHGQIIGKVIGVYRQFL